MSNAFYRSKIIPFQTFKTAPSPKDMLWCPEDAPRCGEGVNVSI